SASGRFLVLRVIMNDRPGELARLSTRVSAMGLNILAVEHHRSGLLLPPDQVEVMLTLETRNPDHRDEVVTALRGAGYEVERKV
ncbi:MAG: ACT domain-containing protein, partial [Acidimicrobiales bacterium]